jgi:hypothetical protein
MEEFVAMKHVHIRACFLREEHPGMSVFFVLLFSCNAFYHDRMSPRAWWPGKNTEELLVKSCAHPVNLESSHWHPRVLVADARVL